MANKNAKRNPMTPVHLLLTVVTCGAWLPGWFLMQGFWLRRQTAATNQQAGYAQALKDLEDFAIVNGDRFDVRRYVAIRQRGMDPMTAFGINKVGDINA